MIGITDTLLIIAVAAVCTFLTRALPFMIFKNAEALPRKIVYLGNVLPMAIMLCLLGGTLLYMMLVQLVFV